MTSLANLADGTYTIAAIAGSGGFVSRADREDKSLNPKPIFANASGTRPIEAQWNIRKGPNNSYILSNGGSPTGAVDNALFAILTESPPPEQWTIESVPYQGKDLFVIKAADGFSGWVLTKDPADGPSQIAVKPLVVFLTEPPRYPSNEVFQIKRVV